MSVLAANYADMGAPVYIDSKSNMNVVKSTVQKADETVKETVYDKNADGEPIKPEKPGRNDVGLDLD
jgi:hypothetical protein